MNPELLAKLLEYIDARIDEKSEDARNSFDGGLAEMNYTYQVQCDLEALAHKTEINR